MTFSFDSLRLAAYFEANQPVQFLIYCIDNHFGFSFAANPCINHRVTTQVGGTTFYNLNPAKSVTFIDLMSDDEIFFRPANADWPIKLPNKLEALRLGIESKRPALNHPIITKLYIATAYEIANDDFETVDLETMFSYYHGDRQIPCNPSESTTFTRDEIFPYSVSDYHIEQWDEDDAQAFAEKLIGDGDFSNSEAGFSCSSFRLDQNPKSDTSFIYRVTYQVDWDDPRDFSEPF